MQTCEDIAPNFSENRPGCFTMTTPRLTLPSSPNSFWRKTKLLLSPTHRTPLIWHPVTSSYFQNWNWSWKDAGLIPLRRSRPNCRHCLTLWQKRTSRKRSKNGDGGTRVYMREGTTSRVTAADRPYGEFYDFYSVSPENFGSTHVYCWKKSLQTTSHPHKKFKYYATSCSWNTIVLYNSYMEYSISFTANLSTTPVHEMVQQTEAFYKYTSKLSCSGEQ